MVTSRVFSQHAACWIATRIDVTNITTLQYTMLESALHRLAEHFNYCVTDPFRLCYPNMKEYTLFPSAVAQNNRCRLNFLFYFSNIVRMLHTVHCQCWECVIFLWPGHASPLHAVFSTSHCSVFSKIFPSTSLFCVTCHKFLALLP